MSIKKIQLNIYIPPEWRESLKKIARTKSFEQDVTVSYSDLIRIAINEMYKLDMSGSNKGEKDEQKKDDFNNQRSSVNKLAEVKVGELLENPESSLHYNIIGNNKCDSQKSKEIGQLAAKPLFGNNEEGSETTVNLSSIKNMAMIRQRPTLFVSDDIVRFV